MKAEQRKYGCIIMLVSLCSLTYTLTNATNYHAEGRTYSSYYSLAEPGIAAVIVSSLFLLFGLVLFIKGLMNDNTDK